MEAKYLEMELEQKYQLLERMKSDCEYYLNGGQKQVKYLWSQSVDQQIQDMKDLLFSIPRENRPEWLTYYDIQNYSAKMDHRPVITAETLAAPGRLIDLYARTDRDRRHAGEIFFSIKRRVYKEEDGKKTFTYKGDGYGYTKVSPGMQKIFDTLFRENPENRHIEFIEWDDSWNVVFNDGIYISSRMCRLEKSEFAEWYRTLEPAA